MTITANTQTDRLASFSAWVVNTRCMRIWSLGKVRTVSSRVRKMKHQTVALVRSKLQSSIFILSSAIAVATNSLTPPRSREMMKPTAKSNPPTLTMTCARSVQITARMPPSCIGDGDQPHDRDAPDHVQPADPRAAARRHDHNHTHPPAHVP